ncbi:MAG: 6-phosphogluconolactonase [Verrucomicrobia bacterium]|nr:6-phosphogluconolactonase [Verrucomicrobiota bacterium]
MSSSTDRFELARFPDELGLVESVAERWLQELMSSAAPSYAVALAGGRITRQFFISTARLFRKHGFSPDRIQFFWGDERCVPPTDPESNYRLAHEHLLSPLRIEPDRIHRIRGEWHETQAAAEAEADICRSLPVNGNKQPILDLVFLGMGEDGHVASLFPNEPETSAQSQAVYRSVVAAKPPPVRITLSYAAIAAARQVWVLASGSNKVEALQSSIAPSGKTPLARIIQMRARTVIFTDIGIR